MVVLLHNIQNTNQNWNKTPKNTVGSHDSNNTVGADATQASPSRHVHHRTSAIKQLWHQTAELANHSRAWEQAHTRHKADKHKCSTIAEKKKPNSR